MDINAVIYFIMSVFSIILQQLDVLIVFMPMLLVFELPLLITVYSGILIWYRRRNLRGPLTYHPTVTCIVACYKEGEAIKKTILSLCEQIYSGRIQIIIVIDGAKQNIHTYKAAVESIAIAKSYYNREVQVLPKWQRGGRVSSSNAGLYRAKGEIVINVDGDTSFDNNMVYEILKEFEDPNVPAVGGVLRVRNISQSVVTRLQALEYMIALQAGKTGLAQWNLINIVSGAFGAFRRSFLEKMGGWDTHSAEDLDLTIRIKQYMRRYPNLRIPFAARAIGHTDVPKSWGELFWQRMRWDGDLLFLYLRKHPYSFSPKLMGWKSYIFTLVYGVLQNILLPLVIIIFNIWMLVAYSYEFALAMFIVQYLAYLFITFLSFIIFIIAISERRAQDLKLVGYLILFPFPVYAFIVRIFTAIAVLNEVFRRGHEESSMAPWWVLKRGKKF